MLIFLLTVVVLSALIIAGYCLNMYLYTRGAVGFGTRALRRIRSTQDDLQTVYDIDQQERDYGLRYARIGILLIVGILLAVVISLIVALSTTLH